MPDFSFGVLHLSKPISNPQFDGTVNSNVLWIGGDDKHFSKESDVVAGGFHGREFVYNKGIASGRALFINAGSRIYLMLFHTEVAGDISSETVSRIFRTFKPAQRGKSSAGWRVLRVGWMAEVCRKRCCVECGLS